MDISPEYIKMCTKAWEIQALFDPSRSAPYQDGLESNLFAFEDNSGQGWNICLVRDLFFLDADEGIYKFGGRTHVPHAWLPRQDDLQRIAGMAFALSFPSTLHRFHTWVDGLLTNEATIGGFASMEQLWLAYAMKQNFNKSWTGDDWA